MFFILISLCVSIKKIWFQFRQMLHFPLWLYVTAKWSLNHLGCNHVLYFVIMHYRFISFNILILDALLLNLHICIICAAYIFHQYMHFIWSPYFISRLTLLTSSVAYPWLDTSHWHACDDMWRQAQWHLRIQYNLSTLQKIQEKAPLS